MGSRFKRRVGKVLLRLLFIIPLYIASLFFEKLSAPAFVGLYFIFELSIRIVEDFIYGPHISDCDKELTGLQIANAQLVREVLINHGISKIEEFEHGARDKYILFKVRDNISIYLYRDGEVNMIIYQEGQIKDDFRYELPDYDDESALKEKFLSQLKSYLKDKVSS